MSESLGTALVSGEILRRPSRSSPIIHFAMTTPNQAMQRTASQPAIYLLCVCHPSFGCKSRFIGLAVADLFLVRW